MAAAQARKMTWHGHGMGMAWAWHGHGMGIWPFLFFSYFLLLGVFLDSIWEGQKGSWRLGFSRYNWY
jgi:hypothetical protein